MKSFIIMLGQSNMAGRGDFGEVPEIVNSNCFMVRNVTLGITYRKSTLEKEK